MDSQSRARVEAIEKNAKSKVAEHSGPYRDASWFKRHAVVPQAPILIATTEDIGTPRVRANHVDAFIDYFTEQEALKKAGVPL